MSDLHPTLSDDEPWPGPAYYEESGRPWFHGRDREIAALDELIGRAPLVTLYGGSGLGKTSLLLAGLFPRLRDRGCFPVIVRLDAMHDATPVQDLVFDALRDQAREHAVEMPPRRDGESLWEYLHRHDLEFWSAANRLLTPVLVLDQFEYLFVRGEQRPADFIEQELGALANLIENRIPRELGEGPAERRDALDLLAQRYHVLLSFREDFLPAIRGWSRQVPSLNRNFVRLEPMQLADAELAVAQAGHAVVEPGLARRVAAFVAGRDGDTTADGITDDATVEPVLLSMFCRSLNEKRRQRGAARIDARLLSESGGDILEDFYLGALRDPDVAAEPGSTTRPDAQAFIEQHLVHGERFRGDFPLAETLRKELLTKEQLEVLTTRHRLLRVAPHPDTPRIELIHDRLVPVVVRFRDQRGLRESQRRLEKEQSRATRLRSLLVATSLLLVVSVVTGAWGWIATRQARAERAERQANQRMAEVATSALQLATGRQGLRSDGDPARETMLRSLAAYRLVDDGEQARPTRAAALAAIGAAFSRFAPVDRLLQFDAWKPTPALAYSPDGQLLAMGGSDGRIHLLDVATMQELEALDCSVKGEAVWTLAFDEDGGRLAAGFVRELEDEVARGAVCLVDVAKRRVLWTREQEPAQRKGAGIYSAIVTSLGGREMVVAVGSSGHLLALDMEGKALPVPLPSPRANGSALIGLAAANGRFLAVGDEAGRLHLLDTSAPRAAWRDWPAHQATIQHVVFRSSDAEPPVLLSTGDDGQIQAWDPKRRCLIAHSTVLPAKLYGLAVTGSTLAAAGADGMVRLMSLTTERCIDLKAAQGATTARGITPWREGDLPGHHQPVMAVAFSPDDQRMASTGADGTLRLWRNKSTGFSRLALTAKGWTARHVVISDDNRWIAIGNADGTVALRSWDPDADQRGDPVSSEVFRFEVGGEPVGLAFSGGRLLAAGRSGRLLAVELGAAAKQTRLVSAGPPLGALAVDLEGRRLALGRTDGSLVLLRLPDLVPELELPASPNPSKADLAALRFTGDGQALAYTRVDDKGSSELLVVPLRKDAPACRVATGVEPALALGSTRLNWLLGTSREGSIREYVPGPGWPKADATGCALDGVVFKRRVPLGPDRRDLPALAGSTKGDIVVVGGTDGTLQLWDLAGAEALQVAGSLPGLGREAINAVAVAPDGGIVVTATGQELLVWPGPARWPDLVCAKLGRNMSAAEWRDWVSNELPYRAQCPALPKP